jgi:hypothetical protein
MSNADIVVVAALDNGVRPTKVEVLAFDPADVKKVFDERLRHNLSKNPRFPKGAPVFVFLDPAERGKTAAGKDLRKHALWIEELPIESPEQSDRSGAMAGKLLTIAMAKEGLSKTYGVPPEAIEITIRG